VRVDLGAKGFGGSVHYVELEDKGSPYRAQALRDLRCFGQVPNAALFLNTMLFYA
jgi:hypothetical protein